jgi:hypothetical protein
MKHMNFTKPCNSRNGCHSKPRPPQLLMWFPLPKNGLIGLSDRDFTEWLRKFILDPLEMRTLKNDLLGPLPVLRDPIGLRCEGHLLSDSFDPISFPFSPRGQKIRV